MTQHYTNADHYLRDMWCILPTCLVPSSSLPEPAQRLCGSLVGRPPSVQIGYMPDILST